MNVIQRKRTDASCPLVQEWKTLFEKEGFEVTVRDRSTSIEVENFMGINMNAQKEELMGELYRSVEAFKQTKELYVYIFNIENASNNTTARIDWNVVFGLGDDAPMAKTFINSYNNNPIMNAALMDKIMGRSPFLGKSPVDPFCGKDYLKL